MKEAKEKKESIENTENEVNIDINADESIRGSSHLNEPVADESELEKLRAEIEESKDKYLRLVAEFDNFKKRTAKERIELIQTAGKDVIIDLLDVLDDCQRAENQLNTSEDLTQIKEGVLLVFNKLKNILAAKGLKPMESVHNDFNPDMHDAITEIPAPDESLKGKVVDEIVKGYYLKDKIIRHAKVVVGK